MPDCSLLANDGTAVTGITMVAGNRDGTSGNNYVLIDATEPNTISDLVISSPGIDGGGVGGDIPSVPGPSVIVPPVSLSDTPPTGGTHTQGFFLSNTADYAICGTSGGNKYSPVITDLKDITYPYSYMYSVNGSTYNSYEVTDGWQVESKSPLQKSVELTKVGLWLYPHLYYKTPILTTGWTSITGNPGVNKPQIGASVLKEYTPGEVDGFMHWSVSDAPNYLNRARAFLESDGRISVPRILHSGYTDYLGYDSGYRVVYFESLLDVSCRGIWKAYDFVSLSLAQAFLGTLVLPIQSGVTIGNGAIQG